MYTLVLFFLAVLASAAAIAVGSHVADTINAGGGLSRFVSRHPRWGQLRSLDVVLVPAKGELVAAGLPGEGS